MIYLLTSFTVLAIITIVLTILLKDYLEATRFEVLLNFRVESWQSRITAWEAAVRAIKSSPLIGYGLGSSYVLYGMFVDPMSRLFYSNRDMTHVHSEILEYTQEGGVIGLVLFLCLWGYILLLCYRFMKNTGLSPFIRKLSLGLFCGFSAFHIEGLFDVPPRMISSRLPLFCLLGIVFLIKKISRKFNDTAASVYPGVKFSLVIAPVSLMLAFSLLITFPYMSSLYSFYRIISNKTLSISDSLMEMEKLRDENPNIYHTAYLANMELLFKQKDQLKKSLEAIDRMVPGYQTTKFVNALVAEMEGDDLESLRLALRYQQSDVYLPECIEFLTRLSAKLNNRDIFKRQTELLFHSLIIPNLKLQIKSPGEIKFIISKEKEPFKITQGKNSLFIIFSEEFFNRVFLMAKKVALNEKTSQEEIKEMILSFEKNISDNEYFQIRYRNNASAQEKKDALKYLQYFLAMDNNKQETRRAIKEFYDEKIYKIPHPEIRALLEEERRNAYKGLDAKFDPFVENAVSNLTRTTHWSEYIAKRKLAWDILKFFSRLMLPGMNIFR